MNNIIDENSLNKPNETKRARPVDTGTVQGGSLYKSGVKQERAEAQQAQIPFNVENNPNAQITLTFEQLMQLLNNNPTSVRQPVEQETPQPENQPELIDSANPGKKIIFQSPDYDEPSTKRSFNYNEDDIFNDEGSTRQTIANIRQNSTGATYTPLNVDNSGFSINEVEYTDKQLPPLRQRQVYTSQKAQPARTLPPKTGTVKVEEFNAQSRTNDDYDKYSVEGEKKRKKSGGEVARRIILIIAIIVIAASGAYLAREFFLHKENEELESEISNLVIEVPETEPQTTTKKSKDSDKKETTTEKKTTSSAEKTIEEQWAEIKAQYPNTQFPDGLQLKYAKLYAINNNFAAYIEIPNTKLSLPVVQTTEQDAVNSYLNKNFYGKKTKYGCPFLSSYNTLNTEITDYNTVVFGHHMNDRTIFGALDMYKSIDGFKKAPVITFNTRYKDYKWKIIAAFITNDEAKDDNNYKFEYSFVNLSNDTSKQTYLNELAKRSLYDTGVDVNTNDKLLTLSTCSHEFDNARFVVVARMVRAGESAEVDTSQSFVNASPRYPQAWYNAKKQENPYAGENVWYGE